MDLLNGMGKGGRMVIGGYLLSNVVWEKTIWEQPITREDIKRGNDLQGNRSEFPSQTNRLR